VITLLLFAVIVQEIHKFYDISSMKTDEQTHKIFDAQTCLLYVPFWEIRSKSK